MMLKTARKDKGEIKVKIGLFGGCGHFGRVLEGISKSEEQKLAGYGGTLDDGIVKVEETMAKHNLKAPRFNSVEELLDTIRPDIFVVDNRFDGHGRAALASLKRGIATYCEKPLALTLEELKELEDTAKSTGALLWAMQTARYDPWFYTAHSLIREGVIGQVRMVNAQKSYRLGRRPEFFKSRSSYGGTIPWLGIHGIDTAQFLAGSRVETVFALHSGEHNHGLGELEMTGLVTMKLSGEILASVNLDYLRPEAAPSHDDDRVRVAGTKGVLEVRARKLYVIDEKGEREVPLLSPPSIWDAFVAAVKGEEGLITTESSLASTRVALTARESADRGQPLDI